MKQTYDYFHVITAMDSISIDDIGNCIIAAYNDVGMSWYLHIFTTLGRTTITEFGPVTDDCIVSEEGFLLRKKTFEYKEKIIDSTIRRFIEDSKRMITQVMEIDEESFQLIFEEVGNQLFN